MTEFENHLLVPINIEALVVGKQIGRWTDLSPDFSKLFEGKILGSQITPALFDDKAGLHKPGIHLHWALPDALTHGRQIQNEDEDEPSGPPEFPLIPNRWMVQRILREPGIKKVSVRAWIVESDYLYATSGDTRENAITIPKLDGLPLFDYAGQRFDYPQWQEGQNKAYKIKLTALGYGDPAFAAYYPACRSVLGFHDAASDVKDDTALTYLVVGWYSDSREDPLFDENIPPSAVNGLNRLGELKWSTTPPYPINRVDPTSNAFIISEFGDLSSRFPDGSKFEVIGSTGNDGSYTVLRSGRFASGFMITVKEVKSEMADGVIAPPSMVYPTRILCHGLICNIQWKNKDTAYESQVPFLDGRNCSVAIGNTSAEALAALLAKELDNPAVEDLLAAFQSEMLAKNKDPLELEALLHQNRFSSFTGGRMFSIQKKAAADDQSLTATDVTLPESLEKLLQELNDLESGCAKQKRELDDYRWELYATWYKQALMFLEQKKAPDTYARQINALKALIEEKQKALDDQAKQRDDKKQGIEESVREQFTELEFVAAPAPPIWRVNDPVLLVSAAGLAPSQRHGHDGRYSEKGELHCRFSGQEISAVIVDIPNGPGGIRVTAEDLFEIPQASFEGGGPVPKGIKDALLQESLLLNPVNADLIAEQVYINAGLASRPRKADVIEQIKALQRPESTATDIRYARVDGVFPSPIALRDWEKNPWLPLFLEWRIAWHASYSDPQSPLENWVFAGENADYTWQGSSPDSKNPALYSGYTVLTPHAVRKFKECLKDYNREKHDKVLDQIITQLGDMNILSQFLGGVNDALIMRDQMLQIPPIDLGLFENPEQAPRDPIFELIKGMNFLSPDPTKPFYPIRAGHMKLIELTVVDAFGQTLKLPAAEAPIRAGSLTITGEENKPYIRFAPRFVQPLRLLFDWIAAKNPPETYPVNSPVCGWVIPNYLDQSLLFYDSRGTPVGALQKILRLSPEGGTGSAPQKNEKAFFWVPPPGTSLKPEDTYNPDLKNFALFLKDMDADTGDAYWNLLDEALAKMDSGVPEDDPLFAVLIGRPLALVRVSLKLQLEGLPAFDQALDKVGELAAGGFNTVKFPLLLGEAQRNNDGLVGFFKDDPQTVKPGPFYAAAGAQGVAYEGVIEYGHTLALDCENPLILTLLLDPRARVHTRNGILPKTYIELPNRVRSAAKSAKEAFFQVAPIISPGGVLNMPKPSDDFGKWSWACRPQVTKWQEVDKITPAGDRAGFPPNAQEISEGWLKLKLNSVAILNFWVKEGLLIVPPDAYITLAWSLQGGDRLSLSSAEDGREPVELWQQPSPFREHFRVQVKAATTYTLTLSDEEGNRSEKSLIVTLKEE
jgi:hypothetical protein